MKMKKVLIAIVAAFTLFQSYPVYAQVRVSGHYRSNGSYVQPHYRSSPDGNFYNNWSTFPNINPYTGSFGTRITPSYDRGYSPSYVPRYSPSHRGW